MSCAACSARVEKAVKELEGMGSVSVNLLKNSMVVDYDEKSLSSSMIVDAVTKAGYGASLQADGSGRKAEAVGEKPQDRAKKEYLAMRRRLIWSIVFTIPLFYISMGHMMGWPLPAFFLGLENAMNFALTLFLLALVVAIINNKYFRNGLRALWMRSPNMDSLIAIGSGASMLYGIYALYKIGWALGHGDMAVVAQFSHDLYFEGAGTILTLISLGKFFEARAKGRTTDAISRLLDLAPKTARVIRDEGEAEVPVEDVVLGDILVVKAGEAVPVEIVECVSVARRKSSAQSKFGPCKFVSGKSKDRSSTSCPSHDFLITVSVQIRKMYLRQGIRVARQVVHIESRNRPVLDESIAGQFVDIHSCVIGMAEFRHAVTVYIV